MFEILAILLAIAVVPCLLIVHHMGFNKGFNKSRKEINTYESLSEKEIDKINDWHKNYVYTVGSYPENWDVIRKINKKIGRGMV